ncbi:MAG: glycosyltransferase family 2 protein [Terriglobia bacterium]|jgi:dolichol-phosphate mannosyltransferase
MISIVLPTFNEARSIQEVLRRGSEALRKAGESHEFIVVDDSSPDRTADLAEALASEIPVRVIRRPGRQGLATAVVAGWSIARGEVLGVMDADLQHPPEVLPRLVSALHSYNADVAIATRAGPGGGSTEDWSRMRRLISWTGKHLAACVLPTTIADVSDCGSGMFLVRARALQGVRLQPTGYRILLEVLGRTHYLELVEVPYMFQARSLGSSKLGMRECVQYLVQLGRLARATGQLRSWIRYAAVGFTGAVVNVGALVFLAERRAWPVRWALAVAILLALVNNFFWNWLFTFRTSQGPSAEPRAGVLRRLLHYGKACTAGMALNASLTLLLNWWGVALPLAAAAGVTLGGAWNIFFNVPAIWRSWDSPTLRRDRPVWDEAGNRRLVSTGHTSSSG